MEQNRLGNSNAATQELKTVKNPFEIQPPPKDFNPLLASNKDLLKHGFPPRPNKDTHPLYFAKWERILSKPIHFVTPTLTRMNRARPSPSRSGDASSDNPKWSGAVLENPPAGQKFDSVSASWTVPTAYPPESAWNGTKYNDGYWQCAQWVGIDGWNNPADLIQAGTITEVTVKNGTITQDAWAWYEWVPNGWTKIDKFAVTPGDTVDFTVCLPNSSLSHAAVWPINRTTSTSPGPLGFDEPSTSANLKGLTVEWIMEDATETTGQLFPFATYGTAFFFDCAAATAQSGNFNLSGVSSNDVLNLSPNPPTILSIAQIISPTVLMTSSPDGPVMTTQ